MVARVKVALKDLDEGLSSGGHTGSKAEPQSHISEPRVASTNEDFFQ